MHGTQLTPGKITASLFHEKGIIFRMYSHFWMVKPVHRWIIMCKNSKRFNEWFICLCSWLYILWDPISKIPFAIVSSAPKGRNGPGQKQNTFHSVGSPIPLVQWPWQDLSLRAVGYQMASEFAAACSPVASYLPRTFFCLSPFCLLQI